MSNELTTQAELQKVTDGLLPISEQVRTLAIKTPDDLQVAANIRGSIKGYLKKIDDWFKPLEDNAKKQVKEIKDKKDLAKAPALPLVERIDEKIKVYTDEESRKITIARAKAADEARKIEDEKKRKAAELNAKELKARQEAQEKSDKLREQGKTAQADAILQQGNDKADALREKAAEVLTAPVEVKTVIPEQTKSTGMHFRENWTAEVTDMTLIPKAYWIVDMQKLNTLARELKEQAVVPGVKFNCEHTPVNTTRGGF